MNKTMTLSALNALDRDTFITRLGGIFEHSPWVAEGAWDKRPFASCADLHAKMVAVLDAASEDRKLGLIRAHPELAGRLAIRGELTAESTREQAGAGLDQCSPAEFDRLQQLNAAYHDKFGFPFILAVKGYQRADIIEVFARRLQNDVPAEQAESLQQIARIAGFRLADLIED